MKGLRTNWSLRQQSRSMKPRTCRPVTSGQQIQAVGQSDSLHGKENFLKRGGLDEAWRIVTRRETRQAASLFSIRSPRTH